MNKNSLNVKNCIKWLSHYKKKKESKTERDGGKRWREEGRKKKGFHII
jgi:hypothetical protein